MQCFLLFERSLCNISGRGCLNEGYPIVSVGGRRSVYARSRCRLKNFRDSKSHTVSRLGYRVATQRGPGTQETVADVR